MLLNLRRSSKRNCRIVVMVPVLVVVVVAFVVVVRNRNSVLWLVVVRCGLSGMEWLFSKQIHSVVPTQPPIYILEAQISCSCLTRRWLWSTMKNSLLSFPILSYPILFFPVMTTTTTTHPFRLVSSLSYSFSVCYSVYSSFFPLDCHCLVGGILAECMSSGVLVSIWLLNKNKNDGGGCGMKMSMMRCIF